MKKTVNRVKLKVNAETIKQLSATALSRAAGGVTGPVCDSEGGCTGTHYTGCNCDYTTTGYVSCPFCATNGAGGSCAC